MAPLTKRINLLEFQPLLSLFLFSIWPFLSFAATNRQEPIDFLRLSLICVTFVSLVMSLLLVLKCFVRRWPIRRFANTLAVSIVVFFNYGLIISPWTLMGIGRFRYHFSTWLFVLLLAAFATWLVSKRRETAVFLLVTSLILVAASAFQFIFFSISPTSITRALTPGREVAKLPGDKTRKPNVYFVVLDGYARADQLKQLLGYDNSSFLDALRKRDFFIADESYANYSMTDISLPSTLNMEYLVDEDTEFSSGTYALVSQGYNSVVQRFRALGYSYLHAENGRTNCVGIEDYCINKMSGITIFGDMELQLASLTPLLRIMQILEDHDLIQMNYTELKLSQVEKAISDIRIYSNYSPFFLFAHVISPHAPYSYHADCSQRQVGIDHWALKVAWEPEGRPLYLDSLKCVNRQALDLTDRIFKEDPDSIIVFQADHGSAFLDPWDTPLDQWTTAQFRERYGILNALRFPEACRRRLYAGLSPVNTFRLVFSCIEGYEIELLPDLSYVTSYNQT